MSTINLGRVQGAGIFYSTASSGTSVAKSTLAPNGIVPLVGDSILFPNGDLRKITAVSGTNVTCGNVETNFKERPSNVLQEAVMINRTAGVTEGDMINLGYTLGLEQGKQYIVKYTFNEVAYESITKYEAPTGLPMEGGELCLCQSTSYEGQTMTFPLTLGVSQYSAAAEDYMNAIQNYGMLFIVDKHQITGDMTYSDDENNSSFYVRALQSSNAQNAVTVELTSIEPFVENVADKAIADGEGNNIVSTYAKKTGTYSEMSVGNAEKLGNRTASEYASASDIPDVSNFYSEMTVGNATNATNATNIIPDENSAVNPNGRKDGGVVGNFSTALGNNSTASGVASTALGNKSTASGDSSIALGNSSNASEECTTALGVNSTASDTYSTALGHNSRASGYYSVALGSQATASESSSVALGSLSDAEGIYSTALGHSSHAYSDESTALGYQATVSNTDKKTMQLGDNDFLSVLRCAVALTRVSDKRDKTDIASITDALAFVERLTPVTFVRNDRVKYISDEDKKGETFRKYGMCDYNRVAHAAGTKKGERRRCGLLAQEVVEALQTVYGTDNYADIVNDNFHDLQEKPSEVENKYTLAYENLVPFLIGAIKELNAEIKILKDKLNDNL